MPKTPKKFTKGFFFWLLISLIFFTIIARTYYRVTDDFRLGNITYEIPHHKEWEIPPLPPEEEKNLQEILSQNFYYLGKGSQCYAFASQDDQYVIKFFKFKHLKPHWFVELLPPLPAFSKYRAQQSTRKQKKLDHLFEGYRLAYEAYRPESALIYIHLNKSHNLHRTLIAYDKIGLKREIDLDQVVFLVQKKGKITRQVLFEDLDAGQVSQAKEHIRQILDFYAAEYNQGLFDKDHGVLHNTGFVNNAPIHLDVGKLTRKESLKNPEEAFKDIQLIAKKFDEWIQLHYPQYYTEISQDIDAKIHTLYEF